MGKVRVGGARAYSRVFGRGFDFSALDILGLRSPSHNFLRHAFFKSIIGGRARCNRVGCS